MFHCLPIVKEKKERKEKNHLTQVTVGGEAKMESGHTFLRVFFKPFPKGIIIIITIGGTIPNRLGMVVP